MLCKLLEAVCMLLRVAAAAGTLTREQIAAETSPCPADFKASFSILHAPPECKIHLLHVQWHRVREAALTAGWPGSRSQVGPGTAPSNTTYVETPYLLYVNWTWCLYASKGLQDYSTMCPTAELEL